MLNEENPIKIAKIGKVFGLNGELTLRLYDTFPDQVNYEEPMFVYKNGLLVPLFINSFIKKGANKAVVIFNDIDSQYRSLEFIGCDIIAFEDITIIDDNKNNDQDDSELYMEDLIGFNFNDINNNKKGLVIDFIDSSLNPLFVVEIDNEEFYIPASDDVIIEINNDNKTITLSLVEGIFEINS